MGSLECRRVTRPLALARGSDGAHGNGVLLPRTELPLICDNVLRLRTFGGLSLERDGTRISGDATQKKRLALLAVLAAEPLGATRDKLAALFWPEADEKRARNALYQAVAAIRRDLGSDVIIASPVGDLRLNGELLDSDVADFHAALKRSDPESAVALYVGPFLDGLHLKSTSEFERWTDTVRRSCANRYRSALDTLANSADASGRARESIQWLRRLSEDDPLDAGVCLRLVSALEAAGDPGAAIRHATEYLALAREELDGHEDERIRACLSRLLHGFGPVAEHTRADRVPKSMIATPIPVVDAPHLTSEQPSAEHAVAPLASRRWQWRRVALAAAGLVAALAATSLIVRPTQSTARESAVLDPRRVVVADFENLTGDSSFNLLGAALADRVTHLLTQAGVARVIDPQSRLAVRSREGGTNAVAKSTAFSLARAAGASLVVSGTLYRAGQEIAVRSQVSNVADGHIVASLDPATSSAGAVMGLADQLASRVAGSLAAALDTRLTSITLPSTRPPNFEAYQEYIIGLEAFQQDEGLALQHFKVAAARDTTFALPLIWAYFALRNAGRVAEADSVTALLVKRRSFLGPLEELWLRYFLATNTDEVVLLALRGARMAPGSNWSMAAGVALHGRNRMREALQYFRAVDPEHGWAGSWEPYWMYYTRALHAVGDYREELRAARRALTLDPAQFAFQTVRLRAVAALGMWDSIPRVLPMLFAAAEANCDGAGDFLIQTALELRVHGDTADAETVLARLLDICRRDDARRLASPHAPDTAAVSVHVSLGVALYRNGRFAEAERTLAWALRQRSVDSATVALAHQYLGRIAARAGDRAAAEAALRGMQPDRWDGEDFTAIGHAAILALLGDRERAVQRLSDSANRLPYQYLHRDPDFDSLRGYAPFDMLATPR